MAPQMWPGIGNLALYNNHFQWLLVFWVKTVCLLVKITAVNWVYLSKHLHGGSVRLCAEFIYITTTLGCWLLGLCVQDMWGLWKQKWFFFLPFILSSSSSLCLPLSLSLSLSFILQLALSSPLYCPMKAEAQLYSRGAEWTDVAGIGRGRDEQEQAAFCKFDSQIFKKRKKRKHKNKTSLYTVWLNRIRILPFLLFLLFLYASQEILYVLIFCFIC